jgi:2-keto-3-deoxy-L-rhamnonate aldolase RhmA
MTDPTKAQLSGLRQKLHTDQVVTASLLTIPDPAVATILGRTGCDFVLIDAEHGPFTLDSIRHCLDAIATTPAYAAVRVPGNEPDLIKQVLELGPDGIQVPVVNNADEARAAVTAVRYAPEGARGLGTGRAEGYGLSTREYRSRANGAIAVIAMIESVSGVDNAKAIAEVPGVDGIFIGPHDLEADMGLLQAPDEHALRANIDRIVSGAKAGGVAVGINCTPDELPALLKAGMSLFLCLTDFGALGRAARSVYERVTAATAAYGRV